MQTSTLPTTVEAQAVRDALDAIFAAWKRNDADDFASWYTPDATVVLPGLCLTGRDELRATMAGAFAGPLRSSRREAELDTVRFLGADAAVVVGRSAIVHAGETQPADDGWVYSTWVLTRYEDRWLMAAYHEASVLSSERS